MKGMNKEREGERESEKETKGCQWMYGNNDNDNDSYVEGGMSQQRGRKGEISPSMDKDKCGIQSSQSHMFISLIILVILEGT